MKEFCQNELSIYLKMFNRESQKATDGLQILNELIKKIETKLPQMTDHHEILKLMKLTSAFSASLSKFNEIVDTLIAGTDEETFIKASIERLPAVARLRIADWIPSDLSPYTVGDTIQVSISHIVDAEHNLCYVKDLERIPTINFWDHVENKMDDLPTLGVVFALEMNKTLFRAIRINTEPTNTSIPIRLIDVGEKVSMSPNFLKYNLSDEAKKMPPMVILSRIEKIDGMEKTSMDSISRLRKYNAKIIDVCLNMLVLELSIISNVDKDADKKILHDSIVECALASNDSVDFNTTQSTNPFWTDSSVTSKDESTTTEKESMSSLEDFDSIFDKLPILSPVQFETDPLIKIPPPTIAPPKLPLPPVPPRRPLSKLPERLIRHIKPTSNSIQVEIPNVEPIAQNDNAIDEDTKPNVCNTVQFPCVTGAYPKNGSKNDSKNPIRKDSDMNVTGLISTNSSRSPQIGDEIEVIPRHLLSFEEMYVQQAPVDPIFDELMDTMYRRQSELKPLNYIPRQNDHVLARYSGDQNIYRARVVQIIESKITVFYIDYGNTENVSFDCLFEWEQFCDCVRAQAILCHLANIRRACNALPEDVFKYLTNHCLNNHCLAVIVGQVGSSLLINLKNKLGVDISDAIMAQCPSGGLLV